MMLILTWRALGHYPPFCYAHWSNPREEMIDCSSRPQPEVFKVNEIVIFVGKVEVEVGKEGNSHCCFTLLLAHQVFDELMQKASNCIASLWWRTVSWRESFFIPRPPWFAGIFYLSETLIFFFYSSGSGANRSRDSEIARALTDGEDTSGREWRRWLKRGWLIFSAVAIEIIVFDVVLWDYEHEWPLLLHVTISSPSVR